MKRGFLLLLIIVIWGCSSEKKKELPKEFQELKNLTVYSIDTIPSKTIEFEKDTVYGNSKEVLIGRMGDIAVDSTGRVFISDVQNQSIYVFQPDGRFLTQLGREGKGPSEFGYLKSLQIHKDRLYAFDPEQYKVNVFTLDTLGGDKTILLAQNRGEYHALEQAYLWIDQLYVRNDDTYLAKFKSNSAKKDKIWQNFEIKGLFYLLDSTGKMVSRKLLDYKVATGTQVGIPSSNALLAYHVKDFFGNVLLALSSDNRIHLAEPDHFLIKVYSPNGVYQHAFYYPLKRIPLTRESAIEAGVRDLFIRNMKSMDLPRV